MRSETKAKKRRRIRSNETVTKGPDGRIAGREVETANDERRSSKDLLKSLMWRKLFLAGKTAKAQWMNPKMLPRLPGERR